MRSPDHRLPLNTLYAFEAVGRHCHVRNAASELHLTHAAVSRQVRVLEEQLEVRLFDRAGNRMQLTSAGQRFLAVVQETLASLQQGVLHLDPESLAGELVIAATATISVNWLPPVIRQYTRRYPEVDVRIISIEPHQLSLPARFDLALCLGSPQDSPGKPARKIYQERFVAVCSPALLAGRPAIQGPRDLLDYTLLTERFAHWEEWFARQGIGHHQGAHHIQFDYGFQTREAARQGLGMVLADQLEIAADVRRGTLVQPLEEALPMDAGIYLASDRPEEQTIRCRLFIEELLSYLASLGAELEQ